MTKKRIPISKSVAAKVLFASDRTCCICRVSRKRVQIHHIDDDPSNNEAANLAVLCFECHGDTQTTGGFGRQLDAEQVRLYRDDWHRIVAGRRAESYREALDEIESEGNRIKYLASLTERLREMKDYVTLADVYNNIGNDELRDKYVDLALAEDDSDWLVIDLRGMQGRRDLIPDEVASRYLKLQGDNDDWSQRARTLFKLGRYVEAAHDYTRAVLRDLETGRIFAAAFYLKEILERDIVNLLFEKALQEAADGNDLWWQVRSLQELSWYSELADLLLSHEDEIKESGNPLLISYLLDAQGDEEGANRALMRHAAARKIYDPAGRVGLIYDDGDIENNSEPGKDVDDVL